jgi:PhoH-like ATPase
MPLPKAPTKKGSLLANVIPSAVASVASSTPTPAAPTEQATQSHIKNQTAHQPTQSVPSAPAALAAPVATSGRTQTQATAPQKPNPRSAHHSAKSNHKNNSTERKLFVLDTNVLLHDPSSLFRFEEHDVFLPLIVLEELDDHKKGMTETARNGRTVSRTLDQLIAHHPNGLETGVPLSTKNDLSTLGKLYVQTQLFSEPLPKSLPVGKADNQILGVVYALQNQQQSRSVVLVSKDINMRIKARALGLNAEDYFNDQVLEDTDVLYSGQLALPVDFWETHSSNLESWQEGAHTYYRVQGAMPMQMVLNQYVYFEHPDALAFHGQVISIDVSNRTATLRSLIDYSNPKHGVWGIGARNREQNFALNVLMDTEIDFVTLLGAAGTGKTLLTIAAALQQTLEMGRFAEVIITRATIAVGEDIGFLPGTEEEKMTPWMGALQDNLEILIKGDANSGEWQRAATGELIKNKVKIKAMSFMRGRTFVNKLLIIDEAQNLTPKQMKTLITRAGPGTKVVCMGNLAQIDTPYLTEGSSGLAYVVEHFKNWAHGAHITLMRGERSRLADFANEVL